MDVLASGLIETQRAVPRGFENLFGNLCGPPLGFFFLAPALLPLAASFFCGLFANGVFLAGVEGKYGLHFFQQTPILVFLTPALQVFRVLLRLDFFADDGLICRITKAAGLGADTFSVVNSCVDLFAQRTHRNVPFYRLVAGF